MKKGVKINKLLILCTILLAVGLLGDLLSLNVLYKISDNDLGASLGGNLATTKPLCGDACKSYCYGADSVVNWERGKCRCFVRGKGYVDFTDLSNLNCIWATPYY